MTSRIILSTTDEETEVCACVTLMHGVERQADRLYEYVERWLMEFGERSIEVEVYVPDAAFRERWFGKASLRALVKSTSSLGTNEPPLIRCIARTRMELRCPGTCLPVVTMMSTHAIATFQRLLKENTAIRVFREGYLDLIFGTIIYPLSVDDNGRWSLSVPLAGSHSEQDDGSCTEG